MKDRPPSSFVYFDDSIFFSRFGHEGWFRLFKSDLGYLVRILVSSFAIPVILVTPLIMMKCLKSVHGEEDLHLIVVGFAVRNGGVIRIMAVLHRRASSAIDENAMQSINTNVHANSTSINPRIAKTRRHTEKTAAILI